MKYALLGACFASTIGMAHAQGCADYPYNPGINIESAAGGVKILATATVSVSFDDVDAINDARDEATLSAKSLITKFLEEGVRNDEDIKRAVNETKSMQGTVKRQTRDETIDRVKHLAGSSSGLLRGVVPLGDCYTAGRELRVTVGVKPETIAQAGAAAGAISNDQGTTAGTILDANGHGPTDAQGGSQSGSVVPLVNVPSYSNSGRLKGF